MFKALRLGTLQRGAVCPAPSELSSGAAGRLWGRRRGCCVMNHVETHWWSLPWKCFCRATAACSRSSEASLRISVKGKKHFRRQAGSTDAGESSIGGCTVRLEKDIPLLWGTSQLRLQGAFLHCAAPSPCCALQPVHVHVTMAQHSATPKVIEKRCPGEAAGATRSPILSQRVDAMLRVHLVQRLC